MSVASSTVLSGTNAVATDHNNLRSDLFLGKNISGVETDAATTTINWSDATKGKIRKWTMGGSRTLAFSNAVADQVIIIKITQDGTGTRIITWPAGITWPSGIVPTLTTTPSKSDYFAFICTTTGSAYDGFILARTF